MNICKKSSIIILVTLLYFSANSSLSLAGEAEDNAKIEQECIKQAKGYTSNGGPQVTPHCQQAALYQCLSKALCTRYPSQCGALKQQKMASCEIIQGMKSSCAACGK
jgi:hypothetical protein